MKGTAIVEWLVIFLTLTTAGCNQRQQTAPPAAPPAPAVAPPAATATPTPAAPTPAAAANAPATQQALATQPYNQNPDLRCEVLEVRRVSGGAMFVRWRVFRPAAAATSAPGPSIYLGFSWGDVYYTDPAENKKYSGLKDSTGTFFAQGDNKNYAPGDQQVMWMKFPAPPTTSKTISFVFVGFPPFEDLPVS